MMKRMTQLDVLFRYAEHPSERAIFALGNLNKVYGIRKLQVNEKEKTIRIEFDSTRLTRAIVAQLVRRAGLDVVEELSLLPQQPPPPAPAEAAPKPA